MSHSVHRALLVRSSDTTCIPLLLHATITYPPSPPPSPPPPSPYRHLYLHTSITATPLLRLALHLSASSISTSRHHHHPHLTATRRTSIAYRSLPPTAFAPPSPPPSTPPPSPPHRLRHHRLTFSYHCLLPSSSPLPYLRFIPPPLPTIISAYRHHLPHLLPHHLPLHSPLLHLHRPPHPTSPSLCLHHLRLSTTNPPCLHCPASISTALPPTTAHLPLALVGTYDDEEERSEHEGETAGVRPICPAQMASCTSARRLAAWFQDPPSSKACDAASTNGPECLLVLSRFV